MSKFKPGDKVTLVSSERYGYNDIMKQWVGKTLLVLSVGDGKNDDEFVCAGVPGEDYWYWYPNDLRLVSAWSAEPLQLEPTDPAPAPAAAKKPLRRGDLVMHRGQIGVVHELDPDGEDGYWVAMLTGDASCVCRGAEDLTRIGSIRKKVKRLRQQFGGEA
jgi:hypothetical protein